MKKRGKRYIEAAKLVEKGKIYTPEEALGLILKTKSAKFVESVEVSIKLGVDPKHADQQVRGTVVLPNGTGKKVRILAIAEGDAEKAANAAGADFVGGDEYIEKIKNGWLDFDLVITTPAMMPKLGKLGKILGTKGLMPNPKSGTVTPDIAQAINEFKKGKVAFRVDKAGAVHVPIGKADFEEAKIVENFKAFLDTLIKLKPATSKGQYLRSVTVALTMGPGIKIDPLLTAKYVG